MKKNTTIGTRLKYFVIYLFGWLSGGIAYFISKNKRTKQHGLQAVILSIIGIILSVLFGLGTLFATGHLSYLDFGGIFWVIGLILGLADVVVI